MSDFSMPSEWVLTELGEIADWGSGGTPSRKNPEYYEGDIPWIKTGDLGEKFIYKTTEYITEEAVKKSSAKLFPKGSVALAMYGATIGKTSIFGIDATTNQACAVAFPNEATISEFLYYFLLNEKDNFILKGQGGAQPNISQAVIKNHEFPLPPKAEQERIAELLDSHLAQVETIKARLNAIFPILKKFRQSVLADAVSGRLLKLENSTATFSSLNKIGKLVGGKTPSKANPAYWENGTVNWVSAKDMKTFILNDSEDKISDLAIKDGMNIIPKNSVLMVTRSGILAHSFPVALTEIDLTINQDLKAFIPNTDLNSKFIALTLKGHEQNILNNCSKAGTTVPSVETQLLEKFQFRLPQLEEQNKIVERVEQLFTYADTIETQITNAVQRVNQLTQSILHQAFTGKLTANWRAENIDLITGDNSAEKLLEQIQKQKATPTKKIKKVKNAT